MKHDASDRKPGGWTLIEIMAVLVIFAIASAIVLPEFAAHDDLKVASATGELVANLLYAQSRAIATGKNVYVRFDRTGEKYQILDSTDPPALLRNPRTQMPFEVEVGMGPLNGVRIESANFDGQKVLEFDAAGAPHSFSPRDPTLLPLNSGSIVLKSRGQSKTISIQPITGQIKVH